MTESQNVTDPSAKFFGVLLSYFTARCYVFLAANLLPPSFSLSFLQPLAVRVPTHTWTLPLLVLSQKLLSGTSPSFSPFSVKPLH